MIWCQVPWRNFRHTEGRRCHSHWSLTAEDTWHSSPSCFPQWTAAHLQCWISEHSILPAGICKYWGHSLYTASS